MPIMESKRKADDGALVPFKKPRNELVVADSNGKSVKESVSEIVGMFKKCQIRKP